VFTMGSESVFIIRSEPVFTMDWNRCSAWVGIRTWWTFTAERKRMLQSEGERR
jgi:hypothetical protein